MYNIVDNFLPQEQYEAIYEQMTSNSFYWFMSTDAAGYEVTKLGDDHKYNFQMYHTFLNSSGKRQTMDIIKPLIDAINPREILRIKANLNPATEEIIEHGMHIDINPPQAAAFATTAVYYLNDNNGYTKFADGTVIESKANRVVAFRAGTLHTGSTCTDQKYRMVININYIENPEDTHA